MGKALPDADIARRRRDGFRPPFDAVSRAMTRWLPAALLAGMTVAGCTVVDYQAPPVDPVAPGHDGSSGSGGGGSGM